MTTFAIYPKEIYETVEECTNIPIRYMVCGDCNKMTVGQICTDFAEKTASYICVNVKCKSTNPIPESKQKDEGSSSDAPKWKYWGKKVYDCKTKDCKGQLAIMDDNTRACVECNTGIHKCAGFNEHIKLCGGGFPLSMEHEPLPYNVQVATCASCCFKYSRKTMEEYMNGIIFSYHKKEDALKEKIAKYKNRDEKIDKKRKIDHVSTDC